MCHEAKKKFKKKGNFLEWNSNENTTYQLRKLNGKSNKLKKYILETTQPQGMEVQTLAH